MCIEQTTLNITVSTVLKTGRGKLGKVSNTNGGSGSYSLHDTDQIANASAANKICVVPSNAEVTPVDMPFETGLTIVQVTGGSVIIAVSFE
jgi:hypothetical protein